MEGLLILIGIYVLDIVVKKVLAGKKEKDEREQQQRHVPSEPSHPSTENSGQGGLQDLIRQFDEAQKRAAQGTYVPPTPPVEESLDDDFEDEDEEQPYLPVVPQSTPGQVSFHEIAESVIQWEYVSIEFLQQAFNFSTPVAAQVLASLQEHHIVGRDMGDGACDLLVHDSVELQNLFNREQKEAEERKAAQAKEAELIARREAEAKHQQELAELEERARKAREEAGATQDLDDITDSQKIVPRSFNRNEIRKGFIWAKVLDEPRFKRRWSSRVR